MFEVWSTLQEIMVPLVKYSVIRQGLALQIPVVTSSTTMFNTHKPYVLPTHCIYVLCGSQNKQRLFPYTTLTDWFL